MNLQPEDSEEGPPLDLLADAMARFDERGSEALEEFLRDHPQHARQVWDRIHLLGGVGFLGREDEPCEVPERLGEYRLLEKLGGGGMGVVYLAEQESLKRRVALKLIRPEHLFFPQSKERFRREVEAVARLQHPSIVQVYSAGEEAGLPYFTMECVRGVSLSRLLEALRGDSPATLDDHVVCETLRGLRPERDEAPMLEARGSSWSELCLRWVLELARALQYTHSRGILHRDLKPSNVMLTWSGHVMLLDFGLASTRESSRITRSGSWLGSLPYMAPEQIRGDGALVDARTDVYAVGVLLYELLALHHPYHEETESVERTRRRILEATPGSLRARNRSVSWETETVCLTAMDPDPRRRYESAAELARDLENVLALRPIQARRPSAALRLRRLAQRNPAWSVGIVLGFLLFVVGPLAFAIYQQRQSAHLRVARDEAELEAAISQATLAFLNEDVLSAVAPGEIGRDATVRAALDAASARIEGKFPDQPRVEAEIRRTIGVVYRNLGEYAAAEAHLERAMELQLEHARPDDPAALRVTDALASLRRRTGRYEEAEALAVQAFEGRLRVLGEDHPDTLVSQNNLGALYLELGRLEEAETLIADVVERCARVLGLKDKETLMTMGNLSVIYYRLGRYDEYERWSRRKHELCQRALGEDHPSTIIAVNNVALALQARGKRGEARAWLIRAADLAERVLGSDHADTLTYLLNLASLCIPDDLEVGERALDRIERQSGTLGERHPLILRARIQRALLWLWQGRFEEAEGLAAEAVNDCQEHLGEDHESTAFGRYVYGTILHEQSDWSGALALYQEALTSAGSGLAGVTLVRAHVSSAECQRRLERHDEAERSLLSAWEAVAASGLGDDWKSKVIQDLIALYDEWGRPDLEAEWEAQGAALAAPKAAQ